MILGYIVIIIGGLIASLGLPSRSGRMGSAHTTALYIGLLIEVLGVAFILINQGFISAGISFVIAFLIPSFASQLRK